MKRVFLFAALLALSLTGCALTTVSDRVPELNAEQKYQYVLKLNISMDALDRITGDAKTKFLDSLETKIATINIEKRADGEAKWQGDVKTFDLIKQLKKEIQFERNHLNER